MSAAVDYGTFLERKSQLDDWSGFKPKALPGFLFDFQSALVEWAIRKGHAAIFADCGLGKTPMQLVWADQVVRHTNRRVLILTPLAVGGQTVREGEKFGIECRRSSGEAHPGITVSNYERLHHFDPADFVGVVCDESSILKNFDGVRQGEITHFMRKVPYRLLCTATASPNDYIELGTSSEALGGLGHTDMLGRFFKNDQNSLNPNRIWAGGGWRFKGHAEEGFWRWVVSWARAVRQPSDLGFDNGAFILPPLEERETVVQAREARPDWLFDMPAVGLKEQREERKRTMQERCEHVASLVANTGQPAVAWCHYNPEGDLLEKMIPDAVQVSGTDSDDAKEEKFLAFASGQIRVLVTKPVIGAFGLNWQHCAHVVFFPSHSYEQYYQAVRRCWRFGQTKPVVVDLVLTEGEKDVMKNLRRKSQQADRMFARLVAHMNNALHLESASHTPRAVELPSWLS